MNDKIAGALGAGFVLFGGIYLYTHGCDNGWSLFLIILGCIGCL